MKAGAFHYAGKPFDLDEVTLVVQRALRTARLERVERLGEPEHGPGVAAAPRGTAARALIAMKDPVVVNRVLKALRGMSGSEAKEALASGRTVREVCEDREILDSEELERLLRLTRRVARQLSPEQATNLEDAFRVLVDEEVLALGTGASDYACHLLGIARQRRAGRDQRPDPLAVGRRRTAQPRLGGARRGPAQSPGRPRWPRTGIVAR